MNVYAIHRQRNCDVDYSVVVCSSKKIAEKQIEKMKKEYDEWRKETQAEINKAYPNTDYECSHNPYKYWIEKMKVITK